MRFGSAESSESGRLRLILCNPVSVSDVIFAGVSLKGSIFSIINQNNMKRLLILSLFGVIIFSSCREVFGKRIRGNGAVKTESRSVGQFNSVHVSGSIDVYVRQDSITSVKVEADENLLEYVIVENDGGTLEIHQKQGINLKPSRSIKVYVSGNAFRHFKASGACDIFGENKITSDEKISIDLSGASDIKMELKAPGVDAELSGAGTITLRGETKDFTVDGSGSTDIKCYELLAENVNVKLSGAGDAQVFASVKLDVKVSGAADIKYKGNPVISQQVSGAGGVKKAE